MSAFDVRIITLEPMRVAVVQAISGTPEQDAWGKLRAWAEPRGFFNNPDRYPVFGFNNPPPSAERPQYGYELWMRVDDSTVAEGEITIRDFPGGRYAVTTCKVAGGPGMPETWRRLWDWVRASSCYKWRRTHELEKVQNPGAPEQDLVLDLYLPIE